MNMEYAFSVTSATIDGGALLVTQPARAGRLAVVTHISGYTDQNAIIAIRDGDAASDTILWAMRIDVSINGYSWSINIPNGVFSTDGGRAISGHVSACTTIARCNLSGRAV